MLADVVTEERRPPRRPVLCRFEDHQPFAYARDDDYYRCSDHTLWAHHTDGQLWSVPSGEPLAYRRGTLFYDRTTRRPLYYQSFDATLPDNTPTTHPASSDVLDQRTGEES